MSRIESCMGLAASSALLLALLAGCGGSGGSGGGNGHTPPPPPPASTTTYTVTLQSVEATFSADGAVLDVSGAPIDGATATLD